MNATQQQPKLYQRIAAEGFKMPPHGWSPTVSDADMSLFLIDTLRKATVIVADDTFSYYLTKWTSPESTLDSLETDCQIIVPPFETYWMEGQLPNNPWRHGSLFMTERTEDGAWRMNLWSAVTVDGNHVMFPSLGARLEISKESRLEEIVWIGPNGFTRTFPKAEATAMAQTSICPFLASHALLSCRNSELVSNDIAPKYHRYLDRKFGKRDANYYRFRTVVIKDKKTGQPIRLIDRDAKGNVVIASHTVIGHVAHYGPAFNKGKLFGKYEGAFFVPPHTRGKREHGRVEKQYVVKPPGDAPLQPAGGDA